MRAAIAHSNVFDGKYRRHSEHYIGSAILFMQEPQSQVNDRIVTLSHANSGKSSHTTCMKNKFKHTLLYNHYAYL